MGRLGAAAIPVVLLVSVLVAPLYISLLSHLVYGTDVFGDGRIVRVEYGDGTVYLSEPVVCLDTGETVAEPGEPFSPAGGLERYAVRIDFEGDEQLVPLAAFPGSGDFYVTPDGRVYSVDGRVVAVLSFIAVVLAVAAIHVAIHLILFHL